MTARLQAPEWLWLAGLTFLAAFVGLLAGVNPGLAIGAAAGCGFVLLTFTNLTLALALFCAEPLRLDFDESGAIKIAAVLLLLAWFGALIVRDNSRKDFLSAHPAMSIVLGLFVGWSVVSAAWAEIPGRTLTPDAGYAVGVGLILITFMAVRTRNQALLVTALFVAGATIAAAIALATTPEASTDRLSSNYADPNELASSLVAGAAISVGVAQFAKRSPGLRLAAYSATVLCVLGIFLSLSRGGLIALGIALIAGVVLGGRWRGRFALMALAVGLSAVFYFAALAPEEAKERLLETTQSGATEREGRRSLWQVGWRMVEANPVQGVGSGNFIPASRHYVLRPGAVFRSDQIIDLTQPAHNTYLEIMAELGLVGFSLFMIIVVFSLRSALHAAKRFARSGDRASDALATSVAVGLIGLLAADLFISQQLSKQLWLLFGLGPALLSISRSEATEPAPGPAV